MENQKITIGSLNIQNVMANCIFTESSEYLQHPMSARTLDDVIRKA